MLNIKNTQRKFKINIDKISLDVKKILSLLNYQEFDLGIWFTTNKTIRYYNKKYRFKDKATDVLSFQYHTELKAGKKIKVKTEEDKNLGDLIISIEYAALEAKKRSVDLETHLQKLIVHGICHLLGYDHIEDQDWRRMRAKEGWLLKKLRK